MDEQPLNGGSSNIVVRGTDGASDAGPVDAGRSHAPAHAAPSGRDRSTRELAYLLEGLTARLLDLATYTDQRLRDTDDPSFAEHAAMYRRDAARAQSLALGISL